MKSITSEERNNRLLAEMRKPAFTADIEHKKKIMNDFGISDAQLNKLFKNREFESLRALDIFAKDVLKRWLESEEIMEA